MLAAMVVICTIGNFLIMIPTGLSIAAVALVGNALGENRPNEAQLSSTLVIQSSVVMAATVAICIATFRQELVEIYDDSPEVMELAAPALVVYSVGFFFDWMQNAICGLIKSVN
jgi:multidrug resistance protein, MATE family